MPRGHDTASPLKKFTALLTSVLIVGAAVIWLGWGGQITDWLNTLGFDFSKLAEIIEQTPVEGEIQVHVIDVGQGDSILIRSADGTILIDAGTNAAEDDLRAYLDACGVQTIDYFVCTHPHEDHIGGADMVINRYDVDTVLMMPTESSTATVTRLLDAIEEQDVTLVTPELSESFRVGQMAFTVLAPEAEMADSGNNASIVVKLMWGATSFLFTGDAEAEAERAILDRYPSWELKCDFLKLGHHGSYTSTCEEFLTAVSPTMVAISCGYDNDYGHPHREVLNRLADHGITEENILRTDKSGTVVVASDGYTVYKMN
ncbi:MAG: MBL fold metallo-hydrolase [Clostridia bacterium]|nr:MBL fold metallo-hydrolase [Clostridia bacterium]